MNKFNINDYFTRNYNLGDKPSVSKFKLTFKQILLLLISVVLIFVFAPVGLILTAIFGLVLIGLPMMKIAKEKKAAEEWQTNYNTRRNTWDAEFDKLFQEKLNKLNPKATGMNKVGVIEDDFQADPFYISGKKYDSYYRYGKDGVARTNHNEITWLFFTKDQVLIYTLNFKMTEDKKTENTQEFFYSDIVSVSTGTTSVEVQKGNAIDRNDDSIEAEEFRLVVPGDKMCFAFTSNEAVSKSIQGMKNLIRTKKNG